MNNPNNIPSPCIHVCVHDKDEICMGCYRSVDEIRRWWKSTDEEKLQIIKNADERKAQKDKSSEYDHLA